MISTCEALKETNLAESTANQIRLSMFECWHDTTYRAKGAQGRLYSLHRRHHSPDWSTAAETLSSDSRQLQNTHPLTQQVDSASISAGATL